MAKYKQITFDSAVRNPERYIGILECIKEFEGLVLNDVNLLKIVSKLYLKGIVSSDKITIEDNTTIKDIQDLVIEVNGSKKAIGGFPAGYASRFHHYTWLPKELGFVYARYNEPFLFSEIGRMFVDKELAEQEAFSVQAMKYNSKSPFRKNNNDFNFFKFIIGVLLKKSRISYEQFIVATFSRNGDVEEFIKITEENSFNSPDEAYDFLKANGYNVTKFDTVTKTYPDVLRRVLIISGFISIRYIGKRMIELNENKREYVNELLSVDFNLSEEQKKNPKEYFDALNSKNEEYLEIVYKYRDEDRIDGNLYLNKIFSIIDEYNIDEEIIIESINKIGSRSSVIDEFMEIPDPLKLEFYISILIAIKYGKEFAIRPNYKADHIGKPYSHAPGNKGDIEIFSNDIYWLIEVTLIRNKTQQLNHETANVIRHLYSNEEFDDRLIKYLSFIAPTIHQDVREFFDYSIVKSKSSDYDVNIKPYTLPEFIEVTQVNENFEDMTNYTKDVFDSFRNNLN
jgi:hypothetical protein